MNYTHTGRADAPSRSSRLPCWIGCLLLLGCASPPTANRPDAATTSPTPSAASTATPSAASAPARDVVTHDVELMTNGNFSADHIGPEMFDAINGRFERAQLTYLSEARAQLEPITQRQRLESSMHVDLIARVAKNHPEEAAEVARAVMPKYETALREARRAPRHEGEIELLAHRVKTLERIATALDPNVVQQDVLLITGGNFAPGHISPAAYDAVNARVDAAPLTYLAEARKQAAAIAEPEILAASFHVPLIERVGKGHPAEAADAARALLPRYKDALTRARGAPRGEEVRLLTSWVATLERLAKTT